MPARAQRSNPATGGAGRRPYSARFLPLPPYGNDLRKGVEPMSRTFGVTILIAAAVVASLTLARQRSLDQMPEPARDPGTVPPALDADLDAIRSAGL